MNTNIALPLSSALQLSLDCLRQAFECATRLQQPVWEFAVECDFLRAAYNVSCTEIRWLIAAGYVEHAVEVTDCDELTRRFHPLKSLTLPARTCLILTDAGDAFLKQIEPVRRETDDRAGRSGRQSARQPTEPDGVTAVVAGSPAAIPVWDGDLHELRLGRRIIKRFRCPAHAQELILSVFEEEGWPAKIDDPLPMTHDIDPKRRLHQTIRNLNRAQRSHGIHFSINGNGQSIRWKINTRKSIERNAGTQSRKASRPRRGAPASGKRLERSNRAVRNGKRR